MLLRRYTSLPALIYLLRKKKITLGNPQNWDDSNDSHFFDRYRENKKLASVLAVCFTQAPETYHHWRVYAGGSSGVCVCFDREKLLAAIDNESVRYGKVEYLKMKDIQKQAPPPDKLPFLKRYGFQAEKEFRIIYESKIKKRDTWDIDIPLTCTTKIILSPWLHPHLFENVEQILKTIGGCKEIRIKKSTLIDSVQWKAFGDSALKRFALAKIKSVDAGT